MTDLDCGNCGRIASDVVDTEWFDGHTWCILTVYCESCKAETAYSFLEPEQKEVYTVDE